ncbi:metallophosphoesterase [Paenibacillus sp. CGMCC 1.16610]|uniref:Metallophosphoesterase n=1 Tax=Paenibacillus anseongense TaxID=2682845 RepID=A0ABW9U8Q2_9BACL|nr:MULTISPECIES: metallophosphoesterase [Paenibacillus]MBA2937454.1 metallophosphoesterase [Paenibacillus sp. CGMCC 1.16610]MVQ36512.1 metallophosphoesterase [Paenibacillus anseongense]
MRAGEVRKSKLRLYPFPGTVLWQNHNTTAAQTVNFSIIGDCHVGYSNSLSIFKSILPKAVRPGSTRFVIFGGDNKHGSKGAQADSDYQAFKFAVTSVLGTSIPYKASIGNWEDDTREQFRKYLNPVLGMTNFPGTGGKVKYVWLDNAPGKFSYDSISLLKSLSANYYYIIDCHWPLRVNGITVDSSHVLSAEETGHFFKSIPVSVRDKVLGIFTHHAHTFFENTSTIYTGFAETRFYVCGCSGAYNCRCNSSSCGRGYYQASLTLQGNKVTLSKVTPGKM